MNFNYIKEFYNIRYGKCYLINEKEHCYLVYATKSSNNNNFIVCEYIDNITNFFVGQHFFTNLNEAQKYFNEK